MSAVYPHQLTAEAVTTVERAASDNRIAALEAGLRELLVAGRELAEALISWDAAGAARERRLAAERRVEAARAAAEALLQPVAPGEGEGGGG